MCIRDRKRRARVELKRIFPFSIKEQVMSSRLILLTPESIRIDSDPLLKERVNDTIFYMMAIAGSPPFSLKRRAGVELK